MNSLASRLDALEQEGPRLSKQIIASKPEDNLAFKTEAKRELEALLETRLTEKLKVLNSKLSKIDTVEARLEIIKGGTQLSNANIGKLEEIVKSNAEKISSFNKSSKLDETQNVKEDVDFGSSPVIAELNNKLNFITEELRNVHNYCKDSQGKLIGDIEKKFNDKIQNLEKSLASSDRILPPLINDVVSIANIIGSTA